jgi:hypothetical protein
MTHLGDAAAALVDGELERDAGDRARAHVACCASCRADVEAQRRLKAQVFIRAASPCVGDELPESLAGALLGIPARRSAWDSTAEGSRAEGRCASIPRHTSVHRRTRCVAAAGLAASVVVGLGGGAIRGGAIGGGAHPPAASTAANPSTATSTTATPTTPVVRMGGTALSVVYRRP